MFKITRMGHTRKLRFASILGVGLLATAGMGVAVAQGGVSAHLALSGTIFNMHVGELDGKGFDLFTDVDKMHNGDQAISRLRINDAKVTDVCMTAPIKIPGIGDRKFQMTVPGQNFSAENMLIGARKLTGDLTLKNPQIGINAGKVDKDAPDGAWGIVADSLSAKGQGIEATSLSADKMTAGGSKIAIVDNDNAEC